jgi:hypothetical protein
MRCLAVSTLMVLIFSPGTAQLPVHSGTTSGSHRALSPLVLGTPAALSVKVTRSLVPRNPIVTFSTADHQLIGRVVRDLNALPRLYSINCPADRGPNYYLLFTYPHQASRLVTIDRSGCVDAGADHLPARTAIGTHFQIFSDLEAIVLADMRPPPPPRGQPPKHPRHQP